MNALQTRDFSFCVFNVENLFLHFDQQPSLTNEIQFEKLTEDDWQRLSTSTIANKPLRQVLELARCFAELSPDIAMLCEVGGRESISNFARYFLGDRYQPFLLEGNSDRGIDVGYLVKRSLPFTYDLRSHKNRSIDLIYPHERQTVLSEYADGVAMPEHRFSRDVVELRIYPRVTKQPQAELSTAAMPLMILMLTHLKSQLDPERIDPQGRDRRKAELEALVSIYNELRAEFGHQVPVLLGGDFNGNAGPRATDPEFVAIYEQSDLREALSATDIPEGERFTYLQINGNRPAAARQLDYFFLSPELVQRLDKQKTFVYRFKDHLGRPMAVPRNLNEKRLLPSDHYPVFLTLKSSSI